MASMTLKMRGRFGKATASADTLAAASQAYACKRDESGEGASTFHPGALVAGKKRYSISYNGKVWDGATVAYDPYAAEAR